MGFTCRGALSALALTASLAGLFPYDSAAQASRRDGIADLLEHDGSAPSAEVPRAAQSNARARAAPPASPALPSPAEEAAPEKDPREGEAAYEQARRLMHAIDGVLQDAAKSRADVKKLPSKGDFLVPPIWTETREDREQKIRNLLDAALGIVTEVPIVDFQKKVEALRKNIRDLEDRIVRLKEKQLSAPKDALLPGVLSDTVDSLDKDIEDAKQRIEANRAGVKAAKSEIHGALVKSGIQLTPEQIDLLLDSVLSGDLVRLIAVFNSAKLIDAQLAKLMNSTGNNLSAVRKYFAMHAALFALLVHAQDALIAKIDTNYLPKLDSIAKDVDTARRKTGELLKAENRPDQRRALETNRDSQKLADDAAKGYRRYLLQQREQIAAARKRAAHDLKIADNTYETVEASFQLRNLIRDSSSSFEAIQKLEAPTFEQIFKNEELRKEFENLTRKLDGPTS
jgi:polyhydroxyalkanoate synthesis regulator phasin